MASYTGLNYRLRIKGHRIVGTLFEVDTGPFIAPYILPVEQRQRPCKPKTLTKLMRVQTGCLCSALNEIRIQEAVIR
jgi:hypothetical protein